MKTPFVEQDCTFEFEGQSFESGGAVVTDSYVIGYMSRHMDKITTWKGELITDEVEITSRWSIRSWMSSSMYQVRARVNGKWFTGRTMGGGMIVRLKPAK